MIGTNNVPLNTPDEIAAGVSAICDEIHQRSPASRILLLGIFPRGEKPDANRAAIEAVNQRIATFEGRGGVVTYLDIGDRFLAADRSIPRTSCTTSCIPPRRAMKSGSPQWSRR